MSKSKLVPRKSGDVLSISPLQLYLQEIASYPLLDPEEELRLAKEHFDHQDMVAAHRLVTSNLRLVVKIANEFSKAQSNLLDLIQEGNYGLMQGVKKFNPYKGVKLATYAAWWIRAYILKYLMDNKSQVRIATTASQRKLFYNLQKETERLLAASESADIKTIAKNLNVMERDVAEMQKRMHASDFPLDAPISNEDDGRVVYGSDLFADEKNLSIDDVLADRQVREIFSEHLEEFRSLLQERDLDIFDQRLLSPTPQTLQQIANHYGISRERARQIESRIVKKLKDFIKEKGTLDI